MHDFDLRCRLMNCIAAHAIHPAYAGLAGSAGGGSSKQGIELVRTQDATLHVCSAGVKHLSTHVFAVGQFYMPSTQQRQAS